MAAGLALAACGGDGDDTGDQRARQARDAALAAGLDGDVADFLARAARGLTATYQVSYPGPEPGTTLVVANRPPDRRVDLVVDGVVTEVRIVLGGEAFECRRDPDTERIDTCTRTDAVVDPPGLFDDALDELTASLAERLDDFTFRVTSRPVAGVEARCLVTEVREERRRPELGERGEICVAPDGALLRVERPGESLEADDYTPEIPDDTFVRPDRAREEGD